jgi:hypothetical protein
MEEVSAGERFSHSANGARPAAGALAEQAAGTALQVDDGRFLGSIRSSAAAHPLRVALAAFALGVALAAILPGTAFENERLGEGADIAKERLNARARDLWQRAKIAVQRASEAAVAAALEEFRRES